MCLVKNFSLTYNVLNDKGTVSEGDTLTGNISFTLRRQTKVKSLFVKATGDATVQWTEGSGDDTRSYSAHRRYFKAKEYLIEEKAGDNLLPKGMHRFNFELKIPQGNMPSSFKGTYGMIAYILTAKMCRRWWFPCKAMQELNFVSNSPPKPCTHSKSLLVEKEIGIFTRGRVRLAVTIDRNVCTPGETVVAFAKITNSSSQNMTPKVSLMQREVFHADGNTKTCEGSVCKVVGNLIRPQTEESVSCPMKTPHELAQTIHNCAILSVDYYLKVYLDIRFHLDPQVDFPIVVIPAHFTNNVPGEAGGPRTAGAQSKPDFPPASASAEPHPVPSGLGVYGDPTLDELPQQTTPRGPSSSDFPSASSSEHRQSPAALPFYTIF